VCVCVCVCVSVAFCTIMSPRDSCQGAIVIQCDCGTLLHIKSCLMPITNGIPCHVAWLHSSLARLGRWCVSGWQLFYTATAQWNVVMLLKCQRCSFHQCYLILR